MKQNALRANEAQSYRLKTVTTTAAGTTATAATAAGMTAAASRALRAVSLGLMGVVYCWIKNIHLVVDSSKHF